MTDPEHGNRRIWVVPAVRELYPEILQPGALLKVCLVPVRDVFTHLGSFGVIPAEIRPEMARYMREEFWKLSNPNRWAPADGEKPDPPAPCPCGSGRRYRKCCMRR